MFEVGEKVVIVDAMDCDYIGKIGIVKDVSSFPPYCCRLNIEGKEGSWGCAWLFSSIRHINDDFYDLK